MSTLDLQNYYAKLLILQYAGKSKAIDTIKTVVTPVIMDQIPIAVQDAFNLETAIGVQLDILGKYAGALRIGNLSTGTVVLSDDDFRILIRFAIIRNNSGSSLATIQALLFQYFPNQILVFDYKNMQMSYLVSLTIGSQNLIRLLVAQGLLPKPMGVQLASVIVVPTLTNLFGFRTYPLPAVGVSPFNSYASYSLTAPWLTYANAITL